jgi:methionine-rich copper-binding protein CopC
MQRRHQHFLRTILATIAILVAVGAFVLIPASRALAHAAFVSSDPAPNTVLRTAPTEVVIHFAQVLSPQGLSIVVYDNRGRIVSVGKAQISFSDPKTASIAMKGDGSDIYRVDWQNVSAEDGDPTLGAFVFGVSPTGKLDKVPANPYGASMTTGSGASSSGLPIWVTALVGIAGLLIGGAGSTALTRRARS